MPRSRKALQVDTTENRSQMSKNANVRSVASTGSERSDALSLPSIIETPNSAHTFTTCTEVTTPVQAHQIKCSTILLRISDRKAEAKCALPDVLHACHDWAIGKLRHDHRSEFTACRFHKHLLNDGSGCHQDSLREGKQSEIHRRLAQYCSVVPDKRQGSQISTCPNNNGCIFLQVCGARRR